MSRAKTETRAPGTGVSSFQNYKLKQMSVANYPPLDRELRHLEWDS